jgi:hypothetical protein
MEAIKPGAIRNLLGSMPMMLSRRQTPENTRKRSRANQNGYATSFTKPGHTKKRDGLHETNSYIHGPSNGKMSSAATKLALLTRIRMLYKHEMDLLEAMAHAKNSRRNCVSLVLRAHNTTACARHPSIQPNKKNDTQ